VNTHIASLIYARAVAVFAGIVEAFAFFRLKELMKRPRRKAEDFGESEGLVHN
jgi:hypothetical protein